MVDRLQVGLVQIAELNRPHRRKEQFQVRNGVLLPKPVYGPAPDTCFVYLPYSVGLLQAYAEAASPGAYQFRAPVFKRVAVEEAVEHLAGTDVAGFSTYVWNINLSLRMARRLKAVSPGTIVVFGGPQVPDRAEEFLRANPFIDLVCHGEGEQVFASILGRARERDWRDLPSVSYVESGRFVTHARIARLADLPAIPSPFLSGTFDPLMEAHPELRWLALWETNRGCPFSCTFCDWGSAVAAKVYPFDLERLKQEADWFARKRLSHVFICDANFGILKRDVDIAEALVGAFERHGVRVAISVQSAKNATERSYAIHKVFAKSRVATVGATLSLQSVDTPTLQAIRRDNISLDAFQELQRRYLRDGIEAYTDMIVGLPGETYEAFAAGIERVIDSGQHNRVAFYNCSVLPNAEMADPAYRARYGIESVPVEIIHEHESLDCQDRGEAAEFLETVVATAAMDRTEWVRARALAWLVEMLYFNRLAQIPMLVLHAVHGLSYRAVLENVLDVDAARFPVIAGIRDILLEHARALQNGNPEYIGSRECLGIWWPPDQYALVSLVAHERIDAFYEELTELLASLARTADRALVEDAVVLNRGMLRLPLCYSDTEITLSHNVLEVYVGAREGVPVAVERRPARYAVDRTSTVWLSWQSWAEDVVMQVYRRSDFLYQATPLPYAHVEPAPAVEVRVV